MRPQNLLKRNFTAKAPNEKWLTDISQVQCSDGKLYIAPVFDCFGGEIISLAMDTNKYARSIRTRLTGILYGGNTRKLTTEHIVDITYRGTDQVFTLHAGEGTGNGYLLLHTIGNHFYSLEGSSLFLQDHLHAVFGNHGL